MLKIPRGVSLAAGSGGSCFAALPPPHQQQPKKVMPVMSPADLGTSSRSSPQMHAIATSYFSQYPQTAAVVPAAGGGCLYATPQGPELKAIRSASAGRLPVTSPLTPFPLICLHPATQLVSWGGCGVSLGVMGAGQWKRAQTPASAELCFLGKVVMA